MCSLEHSWLPIDMQRSAFADIISPVLAAKFHLLMTGEEAGSP